jgi:flagellar biosynthesis/type III secretory pathway protein FliH
MTSSKRVYISSAEEEVVPFALDDLLNREIDQTFQEAAWRLAGDEVIFEPLAIKNLTAEQLERLNRGEPWQPEVDESDVDSMQESVDSDADTLSSDLDQTDPEISDEASVETVVNEPDPEWLESQLALARAEVEVALRVEYDSRIEALETALTAKDTEREQAIAETEARLREEAAQGMADAKRALSELTTKVTDASQQVGQFFEPLSRLAIHVASQLVRGELTLSSTAIARLVQGCLDHLEGQIPARPPVLRLHPDDLERYMATLGGTLDGLEVRADPSLARGDVSIQMNDSAIEDLIQHRLDQLVSVIFGTQQPWAQEIFTQDSPQNAQDWPPPQEASAWSAEAMTADAEVIVDWEPVTEELVKEESLAQDLDLENSSDEMVEETGPDESVTLDDAANADLGPLPETDTDPQDDSDSRV